MTEFQDALKTGEALVDGIWKAITDPPLPDVGPAERIGHDVVVDGVGYSTEGRSADYWRVQGRETLREAARRFAVVGVLLREEASAAKIKRTEIHVVQNAAQISISEAVAAINALDAHRAARVEQNVQ